MNIDIPVVLITTHCSQCERGVAVLIDGLCGVCAAAKEYQSRKRSGELTAEDRTEKIKSEGQRRRWRREQ